MQSLVDQHTVAISNVKSKSEADLQNQKEQQSIATEKLNLQIEELYNTLS